MQGLGRVGRKRGEFGVIITLFNPNMSGEESVKREFRKMGAEECLHRLHKLLRQPSPKVAKHKKAR